jgi:peptidyl-dipeptidase A
MRTRITLLALLTLTGCAPQQNAQTGQAATQTPQPTNPESADQFVARVNGELAVLDRDQQAAGFTQETFITPDTELLSARMLERYLTRLSGAVDESRRFDKQPLTPASQRALMKLKLNVPAPAPHDPARRAELTELLSRLQSEYGEAKYCPKGPQSCRNIDQLSDTLATSRDYGQLLEAWRGWHDTAAKMRPDYVRFVELANEGARELGFKDLGVMWRAGYDMSPEEFDAVAEQLWQQVKPLYDNLHCYARAKLAAKYGEDKVPAGKPIPAHLLGNMWAQTWNKIYDDILKPFPQASVDTADARLKAQQWDAVRMTKSAEGFYKSLGFPALPPVFWERSMLVRPRDREVVCHASAWDMDDRDDVRIKACLTPTEEDLFTIYHELGHVYYFLSYAKQPYLFRDGANDGFHEAIGDTVNLSVTPAYLAQQGLIRPVKPTREAMLNEQMKMALEKIAFLPFGRVIDLWRWKVFAGEIPPSRYNTTWWELRRRYQGIAPPVERTEADFDPGAKYHVPANTPYTRYFLSFILQFQFQKALCEAAGFHGQLSECSVYGSREAGQKFAQMLSLGASVPWQDALQQLTGSRQIDAAALTEYFQPLMTWLQEQNKGRQCGWQ